MHLLLLPRLKSLDFKNGFCIQHYWKKWYVAASTIHLVQSEPIKAHPTTLQPRNKINCIEKAFNAHGQVWELDSVERFANINHDSCLSFLEVHHQVKLFSPDEDPAVFLKLHFLSGELVTAVRELGCKALAKVVAQGHKSASKHLHGFRCILQRQVIGSSHCATEGFEVLSQLRDQIIQDVGSRGLWQFGFLEDGLVLIRLIYSEDLLLPISSRVMWWTCEEKKAHVALSFELLILNSFYSSICGICQYSSWNQTCAVQTVPHFW